MTYIVFQTCTIQKKIGYNTNITIDCIVRQVEAETKEEALGKFILSTTDVCSTHQKLDAKVVELDKLMNID